MFVEDCLYEVYKYLTLRDIYNCNLISISSYNVSNQEILWHYKVNKLNDCNYKELFNKDSYYETYKFYTKILKVKNELKLSNTIKDIYSSKMLNSSYRYNEIIPLDISILPQLTHIYFSGNGIKSIPPEIVTNLKHLHLGNNLLTELPQEIGNLVKLTCFDISCNYLTVLPLGMSNLTNLSMTWTYGNNFPPNYIKGTIREIVLSNN